MLKLKLKQTISKIVFTFNKNLKVFLLLSLPFLMQLSCNTTDPNLGPELKLEDISCTEAWLQLTTNNSQLPTNITLLKNNSVSNIFILSTKDTLLYIDSLLPNQTYKFKAILNTSNNQQPFSNEVLAQTLDTTSHNFTWQTFEFGQHSSSVLYDVAIINENDIWAVGRVYMNDTIGLPDLVNYNAVHWNGNFFELKKIMFYTICGQQYITPYPAKSILAFNENYIWMASDGDQITSIENGVQTSILCLPSYTSMSINKIWSRTNKELFVIGNSGNLSRYTGSNWVKLYSGTDFYLADISGNSNGEIFVIGNKSSFGQGIVLKSSDGVNFSTMIESANISESQIFKPKLFGSLTSVWVDQSNTVYIAGDLFYRYKFNKWDYVKSFPGNHYGGNQNATTYGYFTGIAGNASNDMWIVGERNTVRHFNGVTWQQIGLPYDRLSDIIWLDLEVKGEIVAITGMKGNKAFIMIIKR